MSGTLIWKYGICICFYFYFEFQFSVGYNNPLIYTKEQFVQYITLLFSCRALQALPVNVDPIPKDITEQFGLPSLHDVRISNFKISLFYQWKYLCAYRPYENLSIDTYLTV